jgi:hypothetical protein
MADQITVAGRDELPAPLATLPFDAAHAALAKCFKRGGGEAFVEQIRQKVDNPYEPADSRGVKRVNPYLLSVGVALLIGGLVFLYFTFAA